MALQKTIQHIYFADPIQTKRVLEALMYEVESEVRCLGTKYSVKMEPMYFEWDKFISTLKKHKSDILEQIFNCDHQRHDSEQGAEHPQRPQLTPDCHNQGPEVCLNIVAAFATVHQRCCIATITMVKLPACLMIQPTAVGICHTHTFH